MEVMDEETKGRRAADRKDPKAQALSLMSSQPKTHCNWDKATSKKGVDQSSFCDPPLGVVGSQVRRASGDNG